MELTKLQKFIMKEIRAHNRECDYLEKYNRAIKFVGMHIYTGCLESYTECSDGTILTRYEVLCRFKPEEKDEPNIALYQINMYSDGDMTIYFNGTKYE